MAMETDDTDEALPSLRFPPSPGAGLLHQPEGPRHGARFAGRPRIDRQLPRPDGRARPAAARGRNADREIDRLRETVARPRRSPLAAGTRRRNVRVRRLDDLRLVAAFARR